MKKISLWVASFCIGAVAVIGPGLLRSPIQAAPPTPTPSDSPTNPPGQDEFDLSPKTYDFPRLCVGSSAVKTFTITNTSNNDLHIDSITTSSPAFVPSQAAPQNLLVGQTATFDVHFSPAAAGDLSGVITVSGNGQQDSVTVTGLARDPEISVAPLALSFGALRVGQVAKPRTVVIANTGTGSLSVTGVTLIGSGNFTKDFSGGVALQPNAQLRVNIGFSPSSLGKKFGTLRVTSDACNDPDRSVELRGTGGQPAISVIPPTLRVSATLGGPNEPGSFTIQSAGLTPLTVRSVTLNGPEADQFVMSGLPSFPQTLQPGDVIVVLIRFRPAFEKDPPPEATLIVTSNDPKRPEVKAAVTGEYASPSPSPSPSASAAETPEASASPKAAVGGGIDFGQYGGEAPVLLVVGVVFGGLIALRKTKFRRIARRAGA